MKKIRIGFSDFWPNWDPQNNFFVQLLRERFEVEVCKNPDFLIYSCFGNNFRSFDGIRIWYCGENFRPNFFECDFSFSFDRTNHPRQYRLPYYAFSIPREAILKPDIPAEKILREKTEFCEFTFSNPRCRKRNRFFKKLSRYKKVNAGGRHLNNIGDPLEKGFQSKHNFQVKHKFSIAFENESHPGYVTEKLVEAVIARTVPIYWGDPTVAEDFNPRRFLNYYDYGSDEALIERVIELDQDDDLFMEYLDQPLFYENRPNKGYDRSAILDQFEKIFTSNRKPVAQSALCRAVSATLATTQAGTRIGSRLVRKASKITP